MIHEDTVRQLPAIDPRVETGPVRFGQDWTGLFIRGDNAFYYALVLQSALDSFPPSPHARPERLILQGLQELLASVDERKHAPEE